MTLNEYLFNAFYRYCKNKNAIKRTGLDWYITDNTNKHLIAIKHSTRTYYRIKGSSIRTEPLNNSEFVLARVTPGTKNAKDIVEKYGFEKIPEKYYSTRVNYNKPNSLTTFIIEEENNQNEVPYNKI